MISTILTSNHRITIPRSISEGIGIAPGHRLAIIAKENHLELYPILPPEQLIGYLSGGEDLSFERERDREIS